MYVCVCLYLPSYELAMIECITDRVYRGWVEGGGWGVEGGLYTIHKETDSSSVSPAGHRNSHSGHGRPRRSLTAV